MYIIKKTVGCWTSQPPDLHHFASQQSEIDCRDRLSVKRISHRKIHIQFASSYNLTIVC